MIVYLDTNIVIYLVERNPTWWAKSAARLTAARNAGDTFGISDLTRLECLVGPFQTGNTALEADIVAFFNRPDVHVLPLAATVYDRAARIKAAYRFRTPDALNLAAAAENKCGLFLTNDVQLGRFTDVPVEVLT